MTLLLAIEASKPDGAVYRLAFGWSFPPLGWWITGIARLL